MKLSNYFSINNKNQQLNNNINEDLHVLSTTFPKFKLFTRLDNNSHYQPINFINSIENFVIKHYGKDELNNLKNLIHFFLDDQFFSWYFSRDADMTYDLFKKEFIKYSTEIEYKYFRLVSLPPTIFFKEIDSDNISLINFIELKSKLLDLLFPNMGNILSIKN